MSPTVTSILAEARLERLEDEMLAYGVKTVEDLAMFEDDEVMRVLSLPRSTTPPSSCFTILVFFINQTFLITLSPFPHLLHRHFFS
jgi:hypothetical protein